MAQPGDFQNEIYMAGLRGRLPDLPVDFRTLEARAAHAMPSAVCSYVQGGCGDEFTQRLNAGAFSGWGIIPRMLVNCEVRDLSIDLFGRRLASPLFMSPIGVLGLCGADGHGDVAAARAADASGVPFTASTLSNDPLETVSTALGDGLGMFQLYTPRDKDLAASLVSRAERAGYMAIVVTLDTWVTGWRPRDLNLGNFPQLRGHALANYFSDPCFRAGLDKPPEDDVGAAVVHWTKLFGRNLVWDDLRWLRSLTKLPLVLKGICHPDDARRAADEGIDAIYCSNHGGRQANGGLAAIDLLPGVVAAAGDVPVLFDSGIRNGTDVVKALALGARAVGIGRPYVYGLALGGTDGIVHTLRSILAEADLFMAVNGYPNIAALRGAALRQLSSVAQSAATIF